jgi:hypothetical protein
MKIVSTLLIYISFNCIILPQDIREVRSFHENGKESYVVIKDQELRLKRIENYDEKGNQISVFEIDPITQRFNGPFFNGSNKGYFNQGVLSCKKCVVQPTSTLLIGDFKDGRPIGKIDFYLYKEGVRLDDKLKSNPFQTIDNKEYKLTLNYNDKGELDGQFRINKTTTLYFENGKLKGFVIRNEENLSYSKDSVFRNNKVWKVENQYVKNDGWLKTLTWNEFEDPWNFYYEYENGISFGNSCFFGSDVSNTEVTNERIFDDRYFQIFEEYKEKIVFIKENKSFLTESGIYINRDFKNIDMLRVLISSIYSIIKNRNLLLNESVDISYRDNNYNYNYFELKFNDLIHYTDSILNCQSNISEIFISDLKKIDDGKEEIHYLDYLRIYDSLIVTYKMEKEIVDKKLNSRIKEFNSKCSNLNLKNEHNLNSIKLSFPDKYNEVINDLPWITNAKSFYNSGFIYTQRRMDNKDFYLNFYQDNFLYASDSAIVKLCKMSDEDFTNWLSDFYNKLSTNFLLNEDCFGSLEKRNLQFIEKTKAVVEKNRDIYNSLKELSPLNNFEHPNKNRLKDYEKLGFKFRLLSNQNSHYLPNDKRFFNIIYWGDSTFSAGFEAVKYLCNLNNEEFDLWLDEFISNFSGELILFSEDWNNKLIPKIIEAGKISVSSRKSDQNFSPELLSSVKNFTSISNIKIKNVYVFHFAKIPLYYIELKDKSDYIEFANKMQKLINGLNYQVLLKTSEKESIFITTFNLFELP